MRGRTDRRMNGGVNEQMREQTNARTNECAANETANERTNTQTNEHTGRYPVLGYFAPSGLGGLMYCASNYTTKARIFAPRGGTAFLNG